MREDEELLVVPRYAQLAVTHSWINMHRTMTFQHFAYCSNNDDDVKIITQCAAALLEHNTLHAIRWVKIFEYGYACIHTYMKLIENLQ